MITYLHIKNIGIIDDLEINLNRGLNVLTGETGAGKSLIIGSLDIISGGRFSKEMIRKGEDHSFVEICLYMPEDTNAIDGNVIVSREVFSNGRNMCKINGRLVTVSELKAVMKEYIEIHGQNDNQKILDSKTHIEYLDAFAGREITILKQNYESAYSRYKEMKKELKQNYGDEKEKQRKLDLLKYQVNEIEDANLKLEEEEKLEEKRKKIQNSEKIVENLNAVNEALGENTIDTISYAVRALEKIEGIDKKYQNCNNSLKSIYYELQELSRDVSNYKEEVDFDEEESNKIEERLDLIYSLKRKYGNNIQEILNYKEEIAQEISRIENLEEYNQKLRQNIKNLEEQMNSLAKLIHNIRLEGSKKLNEKINTTLKDLEMPNAKTNIHVDYFDNEFWENGKDVVEIYITTNKGEDEKQLIKIASGGEMSRIMLAIKKALSETDEMPVLVFDEIDTGISGKAANAVADKLSDISEKHQVICISHLASIAASADFNYFISKNVVGERTSTSIKQLNEQEIIEEIARISSGDINEISMQYAIKLRSKKAS
jgi:DNA repair protein RecN (Recombination protein N)